MANKVKLLGGSSALGMDEVDQDYDNLSLDGSQGEETTGSHDVSDYEDNPKRAPSRLHFGKDRCLKLFQLNKDEEKGVMRVCGGPQDCKRSGHKKSVEQGKPGVYDTVKTLNYVDGILSTHRTIGDQKKIDATQKAILAEVTSHLTSSKSYQDRLRAMDNELDAEERYHGGKDNEAEEDNLPAEEWDDRIPDGDLSLTSKIMKGVRSKGGD
jgi:hypothetical protein